MKLFTNTDNQEVQDKTSLESYSHYLSNTNVIAQEALTDYLFKVKDKFTNAYNFITNQYTDKIVQDIVSNKFETLSKIKRINFTNIREHITSKPENFNGKFVEYTLDLINSNNVMLTEVETTLNNLKMSIASFINDYDDKKLNTLYGSEYFKKTEKLLEVHTKAIAVYFPINNGNTKVKFKDILKSLHDVDALYKDIEILDKNANLSRLNYIAKMAKDCSELVDVIIEQNKNGNISLKNDDFKKQLTEAIYIAAREVEFVSALYANTVYFYGSFKNVLDDLNKLSDM
ncbi:MAG: hypothetical protein ACD_33C00003G0001 [uncultured bacterium]|nr:MAG: hypothetical protein ACD_33C00003G0001 [uncultured bacterium]